MHNLTLSPKQSNPTTEVGGLLINWELGELLTTENGCYEYAVAGYFKGVQHYEATASFGADDEFVDLYEITYCLDANELMQKLQANFKAEQVLNDRLRAIKKTGRYDLNDVKHNRLLLSRVLTMRGNVLHLLNLHNIELKNRAIDSAYGMIPSIAVAS